MTEHKQFFEEKNILVIEREKNIWNNTYKGIVYLDRDGVIIEDYGYVGKKERVDLIKGAQKAIKEVISRGFLVGVITNQSGIGRGYYSWKDYIAVTDRMIELLGEEAEPSVIIASGVSPNTGCEGEHYRKPNIGMINYIRKEVLRKNTRELLVVINLVILV